MVGPLLVLPSLFLRYDPQRGGDVAIAIATNVIVSVAGDLTGPRGIIEGDVRSADDKSPATSEVTEGGSVARRHRTSHHQNDWAEPFDGEPGESIIGGYAVVGGSLDKGAIGAGQDDAVKAIFVDLDGAERDPCGEV